MTAERNYGIDVLRVLSMFMVVILHVLGGGGVLAALPVGSVQYCVLWLLEISCLCCVNTFALISGYVGYGSRHRVSRIVLLWLEVVLFVLLENGLMVALGFADLSIKMMGQTLFPVTSRYLWFVTSYVMAALVAPLIDSAIASCEGHVVKRALLSVFMLSSVFSLAPWGHDSFNFYYGYSPVWLMYLYAVGAYIKVHGLPDMSNRVYALVYSTCVCIGAVARYVAVFLLGIDGKSEAGEMLAALESYTSPLLILEAVSLLMLFRTFRMGDGVQALLKRVTPAVFGVYVIHNHRIVFEELIEGRAASFGSYPPLMGLLAVLAMAASIFFICLSISYMRVLLFQKLKVGKRVEVLLDRRRLT